MERFALEDLSQWLTSKNRKPMVLRGARQVGKTWIVRHLAETHNLQLVEINLERNPNYADLFTDNDPLNVIQNIEAELSIKVTPNKTLLFLDEIQIAPQLFSKLRWFQEELPQLAVITAGSLIEFALNKLDYSMPVGRITFYYLEQLSFLEFIKASGHDALFKKLVSSKVNTPLPDSLHQKCLRLLHDYCLVGGMPEVVNQWIETKEFDSCLKIQQDLLATYRDDFHKYGGNIDATLLSRVILSISEQLGNKFVYSRIDPSLKIGQVKKALEQLCNARVCTKVFHTSANNLPLGAEANEKFFKMIMLDVGLVASQLALSRLRPSELHELIVGNKGAIAEQFIGQQLRTIAKPLMDSQLFYWQRTGGRLGEVDYIFQSGTRIIPVEVKSGTSGNMKSLHQFMADKKLDLAVRFYSGKLNLDTINLKTTLGQSVSYKLFSIPHYLVEQMPKYLDQLM
ncbi:MAG: ATP-binding protein [Proteobacteria bacterium]|nr:ATP-binding protein [Pseudomonadota bacterium]